LPGHDEVFIIGDLAAARSEGKPVPGVAGAAVQMGRHAAKTIQRQLQGKPPLDFKYVEKGSLATIGRSRAIALFPPNIKLRGFVAWWAWLFIHVLLLIGFRNRLLVVLQWAWAYVTFQRGARLITGPALDEPVPPSGSRGLAAIDGVIRPALAAPSSTTSGSTTSDGARSVGAPTDGASAGAPRAP
jgi:NADH dehydrogenase